MTSRTLILGLLACALCVASADQYVSDGVQAGQALTDQGVQRIALTQNVNLNAYTGYMNNVTSNGANPYTLTRSVEIYSSGSTRFALDFAYLAGYIILAPGVTITFTNIRMLRSEVGIPVGVFKSSPGAFVVIQNSDDHREVCPASSFAQAFFLNVARAGSGTQSGYTQADGSFIATDVALVIPTTPAGLGGYTLLFKNTALTCDTILPLPEGYCTELPNMPSNDCLVAVRTDIKQGLCRAPGCINTCARSCSL